MVETYNSILTEFNQKYHNYPDQFADHIRTAFDKANLLSNKDGINQIFCNILRYRLLTFGVGEMTLDQIKYMIELGADPTFGDNYVFYCALTFSTSDAASYLVDICNINSIDTAKLDNFYIKVDTLKMLLHKKLLILDKKIMSKLVARPCFIQALLEEGVDFKDIIIGLIDCGTCILRDKEIYHIVMDKLKNKDMVIEKELLKSLFDLEMTSYDLSVDGINIFMDAGLDIDEITNHFDSLCKFDMSIPLFIMNQNQIDVNMNNSRALTNALENKRLDTVKLLLELGARVTNHHIGIALDNQDMIEVLITYGGVSAEYAAKILAEYFFNGVRYGIQKPDHLYIAKKFIHDGIDFNEIILNTNDNDENRYGMMIL